MLTMEWSEIHGLTLNEPLWIASSHLTGNEAAIRQLRSIHPAAATLKTTSQRFGGDGRTGRRTLVIVGDDNIYCDGPKQLELLNLETTRRLLAYTKAELVKTHVGISILLGEDFEYCASQLLPLQPAFVELNLKYSVRRGTEMQHHPASFVLEAMTSEILTGVERCCRVFSSVPVLVKLTREIPWLGQTTEMYRLIQILHHHGKGALLVANTAKSVLAPSSWRGNNLLEGGILAGRRLFDHTFHLIRTIAPVAHELCVPIVATGGITGIAQAHDSFIAGASAVQLCTALQLRGLGYYQGLYEILVESIRNAGFSSFMEYLRFTHQSSSNYSNEYLSQLRSHAAVTSITT